ncbi:CubicO group peptidase, beta-lactamase class C family [Azospirillum oryzae]|uniref:CubicO group peptidase, beta-lactamase class C family n=1 Tax=Azospirillum oryzae TaxID=286727 RepID=A0A1X7GBI6_9PROT|nr:serine hydrolase domain-containing protein [Azospirillum oryzae]SMF67265.1 CubicO group peptidase, beta-lactamase class C family [Azospirillum oryzae]
MDKKKNTVTGAKTELDLLTAALAELLGEESASPAPAGTAIVAFTRGRGADAEPVRTLVLRRKSVRGAAAADLADRRALVYSLTKTILAAAVLRLAARGVVDLDGPAERWLPELAGRPDPVSVAQILTHRAGLPDYGGRTDYHAAVAAGAESWSGDEFLARCGVARGDGPPVGSFAYSNIGYLLIGRLLERAGGAPLAEMLAREVFGPLGLSSASLLRERADLAGLFFGPSPTFGGTSVEDAYHPGWVSHGVVAMTAADACRLVHGLTEDYLPDALLRRMRDGLPVGGPMGGRPWVEPSYGLGMMVELDPVAGPYWGHTGGGPGVTPAAYHAPGPVPVSVAVFLDGEDGNLAEWMAVEVLHRLRGVR